MEGELWVGMVGNRSFLISLNRWNAEREKRFKLSIMSLWFQFIPISKKKKNKTKKKQTNKQNDLYVCLAPISFYLTLETFNQKEWIYIRLLLI